MPWHVHIRLPDGRTAVADYRDPIVPVIRQARGLLPGQSEIDAITRWLDAHFRESAECESGACRHD